MESNPVREIILPIVLGVVSSIIYALLVASTKGLWNKAKQISLSKRVFISIVMSVVVYSFVFLIVGLPFSAMWFVLVAIGAYFTYALTKNQ